MIGIAVWGLGRHAFKNLLPAIAKCRHFELVGVCSRNEAKRATAVQNWGGLSWSSPDDLLRCERVQAVYVATPTGLHFSNGMDVLGARKHLISEKSLTADPEQSLQLIARAREQRLVLCEALMFQYHPQFRALKETIHSPAFGKVLQCFSSFGLPALSEPGFRTEKSLGGGALLDLGCYPLAMMRALFGDVQSVLHARLHSSGADAVDTAGEASLVFLTGVRADLAWGYNRAYSAELLVSGETQSIYATRVFSKDEGEKASFVIRDQVGKATTIEVPPANAFVEMFDAFVEALAAPEKREKLLTQAAAQARLLSEVLRSAT